jgi:two-component system, LuxR family, sensor kinase FixL
MLALRQLKTDATVNVETEHAMVPTTRGWLDRHHGNATTLVASATFVLLYVALDAVTFVFAYEPFPVTPWNPNAGLAIAMIVAGGRRYVPAVLLAALLSEIPLLSEGASPFAGVAAGLGPGAAYAGTALIIRHFATGTTLERLHDLRPFLIAVAIGTALSAAFYVQFNLPAAGVPLPVHAAAFFRMWIGDLTGTIGTAPLLFLLDRDARDRDASAFAKKARSWVRDIVVFVAVLAPLLGLIFGLEPIEGHKLFYLLFVPLIALAMKRGYEGAAVGVAVVQIALIGALLATDRSAQSASEFQLLMLVLALTTLLLGAVASERKRALIELERRSVELRAQQTALADALRVAAASEMASALAHELAQPLSAIGSYARAGLEMLRLGTAEPADLARALERVEKETVRTGKTVRRIRDFFRSGTSHLEAVELEALVNEAVSAVHDYSDERTARVNTDVAPQLPRVFADRVQVGTVLHNLLINALDAAVDGPAPGVVQVTAHRVSSTAVAIDVMDSGPGVAAAVRDSLFEPLTTTKPSGMGLGLAISKTIVEAHGGQLALLAGQPTIFRLVLPIHVDTSH